MRAPISWAVQMELTTRALAFERVGELTGSSGASDLCEARGSARQCPSMALRPRGRKSALRRPRRSGFIRHAVAAALFEGGEVRLHHRGDQLFEADIGLTAHALARIPRIS